MYCTLGSAGKEPACNAGDLGSIPGLRRSPGEGKGYPLQYSGLENSMDFTRVRHNWMTFTSHIPTTAICIQIHRNETQRIPEEYVDYSFSFLFDFFSPYNQCCWSELCFFLFWFQIYCNIISSYKLHLLWVYGQRSFDKYVHLYNHHCNQDIEHHP